MATQLSIVNGALNELGQLSVSNVNDDDNAKLLDEKVDLTYRSSLDDTNWTFAEKFTALALTTETGIPQFSFVYQLPVDLERIVKTDRITQYEILADKFYTNQATNVNIFYISNLTAFNLWPVSFEKYIIYKLASEAALVVTNNVGLTEFLKKKSDELKYEAIADNANREAFRVRVNNQFSRRVQVL